jgi:peptidoglycan hydrolase CwlO-like protein
MELIAYAVAIIAVVIGLWVKWEQTEDQCRQDAAERRQQEFQREIDTLQQQIDMLEKNVKDAKDPFKK